MRYALTGRVVTIDRDWTVLEHGAVYVADDRIARVLPAAEPAPADFADAPRIATRGTIYPGLIELHNHLSYNALPLWPPTRAYRNRGEWQVVPAYRKWVSGPMTVVGKTVGLSEAVVRYVECKCLVGGVTTSQGIALYSNNGIQAYYRGNIRNVESTQEADLIDADTRIPDVDARDAEAFLARLRKTHRLILHLAEGLGPTAREHFSALHLADGRWALAPSLVAIHANGLEAADFRILAENGVGMVWSPLSNLLLYGGTADVAAAHAAGVPIALGSDWSPSGSRNLLAELKVARVVNASRSPAPFTDRDLVAMATRVPAAMLGWDHAIGSVADGKLADLLVVDGTSGDPYDHLLRAGDGDIALVVVDGVARFGQADLMAEIAPDAEFESVRIGGRERRLLLTEADVDPIIGGLTLAVARARLTDALGDLAALALRLEHPPVGAAAAALNDPTPRWFLQLDVDEPPGIAIAPHLPGSDGRLTAMVPPMPGAAAIPLSKLLEPMTLDPLSVADEPGYWARLASQPTIPGPIRAGLAALD